MSSAPGRRVELCDNMPLESHQTAEIRKSEKGHGDGLYLPTTATTQAPKNDLRKSPFDTWEIMLIGVFFRGSWVSGNRRQELDLYAV
jgi:hypothetical protein